MRLSAREPIAANPSARQALTASSVSNTCSRTRSNSEISISARIRPTEKPSSRRERASHARPDAASMSKSVLGGETPRRRQAGTGALHREFQWVRCCKHLPVRERNDREANLEPSVTVARAIERVESFPRRPHEWPIEAPRSTIHRDRRSSNDEGYFPGATPINSARSEK